MTRQGTRPFFTVHPVERRDLETHQAPAYRGADTPCSRWTGVVARGEPLMWLAGGRRDPALAVLALDGVSVSRRTKVYRTCKHSDCVARGHLVPDLPPDRRGAHTDVQRTRRYGVLSAHDVREIRRLHVDEYRTPSDLSRRYPVSPSTIAAVLKGEVYRKVHGGVNVYLSARELTARRREVARGLYADGWSQERIAEHLGVAQNTVSLYVRGVTGGPRNLPPDDEDGPMDEQPAARGPLTKMTEQQVVDLVAAWRGGESQRSIAARLGVTTKTVSNVIDGVTWRHVTGGPVTGRRPWRLTDEEMDRVVAMRRSGATQTQIAEAMERSVSTIRRVLADEGMV